MKTHYHLAEGDVKQLRRIAQIPDVGSEIVFVSTFTVAE